MTDTRLTRRFAIFRAALSTAALAVPAVEAAQQTQDVDLARLSNTTIATILCDVFDHSTLGQQTAALKSLRDTGGDALNGIADIL